MPGEPDNEVMQRGDRLGLMQKPEPFESQDEEDACFDPRQPLTEDDRAYRILEHLGIPDWSDYDVTYIAQHIREAITAASGDIADAELADPFGEGGDLEPYPIQRQPREED